MRMIIQREALLEPLQLIAGTVEKKQVQPVLSCVLMIAQSEQLSLVGTNLEAELISRIPLNAADVLKTGEVATPAHKLMDICRLLPDKALLEFSLEDSRLTVKSGRSRFVLSTFSTEDFPSVEEESNFSEFVIRQMDLRYLIEKTSFAMAEQDVRHFLNGLQIQIHSEGIKSVAADGHRMAFGSISVPIERTAGSAIIPRKGINELLRLLNNMDENIIFGLSNNHIRVVTKDHTFTSKLIDNGFINYDNFIPKACDISFTINREELKQAITRIAVLSNDKIRGIRFQVKENKMKVLASNMAQEYGEEELNIENQTPELEIAFSANYLLDALSAIRSKLVKICCSSLQEGLLVKEPDQEDFIYILMPIL
jgi:DNA polymerase-3 subunit beta